MKKILKNFLIKLQYSYLTKLFVIFLWAPLHAFLFNKIFHNAKRPISTKPFKVFQPNNETESFSLELKKFLKKGGFLNNLKQEMLSQPNQKSFVKDIFPILPIELRSAAYKIAIDDFDLRSYISSYFGFMPRIHDIAILYNVPIEGLHEEGSKLWHRDSGDCDYKNMKVFMPITDISTKNGPFYYFIKNKYFAHHNVLSSDQKSNNPWISNRVSNLKVNSAGGEIGSTVNFKSGTRLLIDTVNTYHKGGFCESEDRLMLQISYHPNSYNATEPYDFSEEINFLKNTNFKFYTKEIISEVMGREKFLNQTKSLLAFKWLIFKIGNIFVHRN